MLAIKREYNPFLTITTPSRVSHSLASILSSIVMIKLIYIVFLMLALHIGIFMLAPKVDFIRPLQMKNPIYLQFVHHHRVISSNFYTNFIRSVELLLIKRVIFLCIIRSLKFIKVVFMNFLIKSKLQNNLKS